MEAQSDQPYTVDEKAGTQVDEAALKLLNYFAELEWHPEKMGTLPRTLMLLPLVTF